MLAPWQTLRDGGVPVAVARSGGSPTIDELAAATLAAIASEPSGREAEALAAWLFAWQQHWPEEFRRTFREGTPLLAWAAAQLPDANRYLKLRRIALENLARVM